MLRWLHVVLDELVAARVAGASVDPRIAVIKTRITELLARRLPALAARAKAQEVDGELPGVYQAATALRRKAATKVDALQDDAGNEVRGQHDLEQHAKRHFSKVLGELPPAPSTPPRLLLDVAEKIVTEQDNKNLLEPITEEELLQALKLSPRGRSPGDDGLTAELYLVVWEVVKADFLVVANEMLRRRRVAPSHTRGVMTLIPKDNTVSRISDLRPVTLLNTDGKVFSRVLARRLEAVQGKVLDSMQVRGGHPRNMHGALLDLRDAVNVVEVSNRRRGTSVEACLVSVDFAGAFNSLLHGYLWEVLRRYGLDENIIELLRSMYTGASTTIRLNGVLGPLVRLSRGVRQGCPLSMLLFNIAVSPLIKVLNKRLGGVQLPDVTGAGRTFKLAATSYVDDATVMLGKPEEMPILMDALQEFGAESGLLINVAKTKALPLGSWSTSTPSPVPYVEQVKILGIVFSRTTAGMVAANWPARLQALRGVLVDARLRALNLLQRVQYANMYALSIFWHCAQVLPVPAGVAKDARKALSRFLWAGEPLRVPLDVLVLPPGRGGLGLHDPTTKSRAMFTARWLTAARSTAPTLSGGWLAVLQELYDDAAQPPPAARLYRTFRATCSEVDVPDDVTGPLLNRAVYQALIANLDVIPRVQRRTPTADWSTVWARIATKTLPLPARSAWFRAVHDVLPTNSRLKATNQADDAACRTCGEEDTVLHRLTSCQAASRAIWRWAASQVASLTGAANSIEASVLVVPDVTAPSEPAAKAVAWLLGTVAEYLVENAVHDSASFAAFAQRRQRLLPDVSYIRNIQVQV